jgi:lysophospholipase L1-like esterase
MDACSPEYREHYARQLEQMHTVLTEGDEQRQLLLTTTRPFTNLVDPSWARCQTDQLRQLAATHDNVEVLELAAHVCTESECQQQTPEGNALYLDTVHFTPTGIGWLAPWLADELTRATTPAST